MDWHFGSALKGRMNGGEVLSRIVLIAKHSCPSCGRQEISRNSHPRHGQQNYKCRNCGRQFVLDPLWKSITPEQYGLIKRILLERISLAGMARVLQISED